MIAAVACPDVVPLTEVVVSFACVPAELATRWSLLLDRGLFDPVWPFLTLAVSDFASSWLLLLLLLLCFDLGAIVGREGGR